MTMIVPSRSTISCFLKRYYILLSPWKNDLGLRIFKKFALCLSVEGVKVVI